MKVLAINGCPAKTDGTLTMLVEQFIEGMKEANADVEIVNTELMNILPCRACTEDLEYISDGNCKCDDDMQLIYPKLKKSEIWLFIVPIAQNIFNNNFRNFLDRLEPLFQPELKELNTITGKKKKKDSIFSKDGILNGKVVFISSYGDWDIKCFEPLESQIITVSSILSREYAGSLLRPHEGAVTAYMQMGIPVYDILEAARDAGRQIVSDGKINDDAINTFSRQLLPRNSFISELSANLDRMHLSIEA